MWHRLDTAFIRINIVLRVLDALFRVGTSRLFLTKLDQQFVAIDKSLEEIKSLISIFEGL